MNFRFFLNQWFSSVFLPSDTRKAGTVNIFRSGREHFTKYSQIFYIIEFACSGKHRLSCESFAHFLCLLSAFGVIDSAYGIVTSFPANSDRRVVAEINKIITKCMFPYRLRSTHHPRNGCYKYQWMTFLRVFVRLIDGINYININLSINFLKVFEKLNIKHRH